MDYDVKKLHEKLDALAERVKKLEDFIFAYHNIVPLAEPATLDQLKRTFSEMAESDRVDFFFWLGEKSVNADDDRESVES